MITLVLCLLCVTTSALGALLPGYHFTEGRKHTTLSFKIYRNLIIIPATLNDTLDLHLILDTGTRSIVLYGKKFRNMSNILADKKLQLSGWGSSGVIDVKRSFPNTISIGEVIGEGLCAAVVDNRKLFHDMPGIDGIIGYEIFVRFAVEIDYKNKVIHLYDKIHLRNTDEFIALQLDVKKARPEINASIELKDHKKVNLNLLVDTGSSLGLAIFSKDTYGLALPEDERQIGIGLAGAVFGFDLIVNAITFGQLELANIHSHLVHVKHHPDKEFTLAGSLGAGFLKDYLVIFDYPTNRLYLKKNSKLRSRR